MLGKCDRAVSNARHQNRQREYKYFGITRIHEQRFKQQRRANDRHRTIEQRCTAGGGQLDRWRHREHRHAHRDHEERRQVVLPFFVATSKRSQ